MLHQFIVVVAVARTCSAPSIHPIRYFAVCLSVCVDLFIQEAIMVFRALVLLLFLLMDVLTRQTGQFTVVGLEMDGGTSIVLSNFVGLANAQFQTFLVWHLRLPLYEICSRHVLLVTVVFDRSKRNGHLPDKLCWRIGCWNAGEEALSRMQQIRNWTWEAMIILVFGGAELEPVPPTMRQGVQYFDLDVAMPEMELLPDDFVVGTAVLAADNGKEPDNHISFNLSSVQASVLSAGR
ncbi:hypothetical protein ACLOJK_012909 [Asimina triloba]